MRDNMLDKVRALLAKAESTTFEEEADAYRDMATRLMTKYEIDEALLSTTKRHEPREIVRVRRNAEAPYAQEKLHLWSDIGKAFGVKSVFCGRHARPYKVDGYTHVESFGTQAAHDLTELLVTSLMVQAANGVSQVKGRKAGEAKYARTGGHWAEYQPTTASLRAAWLTGFFERVAERVAEAHRQVTAEASGSTGELVLVSDARRANQAMREAYPSTGKVRSASVNHMGHAAGRSAGDRANIGSSAIGGGRPALGSGR